TEESQQALQTARQGTQTVEQAVGEMEAIQQQVDGIAETMLGLAREMQAIGTINTTVNELADQSNLLALNAAIEYARAGEQGKSFAVVANHVRELAERSKQATQRVRRILADIQHTTKSAVAVTQEGRKRVVSGVTLVEQ